MIVSKNGKNLVCLELSIQEAELMITLLRQGLKGLGDQASVVALPALKVVKQLYDRISLSDVATEQEGANV